MTPSTPVGRLESAYPLAAKPFRVSRCRVSRSAAQLVVVEVQKTVTPGGKYVRSQPPMSSNGNTSDLGETGFEPPLLNVFILPANSYHDILLLSLEGCCSQRDNSQAEIEARKSCTDLEADRRPD